MNPYEAPQSSLHPEQRPRVAGKDVLFVVLVLIEITLGVLLLECLAAALSIEPRQENQIFSQMMPYVAAGFGLVGGILWQLKRVSERKNS